MPDPAGVAQIKCQDLLAALAVFLIVVAATFTVVLPLAMLGRLLQLAGRPFDGGPRRRARRGHQPAGRMMKMRANWQLASAPSPRPTVSRLCRTLVEMGYLDRDERIDR